MRTWWSSKSSSPSSWKPSLSRLLLCRGDAAAHADDGGIRRLCDDETFVGPEGAGDDLDTWRPALISESELGAIIGSCSSRKELTLTFLHIDSLTRRISTLHCRLEPIGEGAPHATAGATAPNLPPLGARVGGC